MAVNKKAAAKNVARFTAARKLALAGVSKAAFHSGTARNAVIAATFGAAGKKPTLTLYRAIKLELQVGFMAAALARKGDNRAATDLIEHCRSRLTDYAGFGGKGKLKTGQKGRRTKAEEDAYASARVLVSGVFKDAGVTVPETRGGDTSGTRGANTKPKAKTVKAAKAANDAQPVVKRYKDKPALIQYAAIQAAALLSTVNRNAAIAPIELKSAIQDFAAAIKKLQA